VRDGAESATFAVSAANSWRPEYPPEHREVYHNHEDCYDGKRIKKEHREPGKGGKKQCKVCIGLD